MLVKKLTDVAYFCVQLNFLAKSALQVQRCYSQLNVY